MKWLKAILACILVVGFLSVVIAIMSPSEKVTVQDQTESSESVVNANLPAQTGQTGNTENVETGELFKVSRVVDGDTFEIEGGNVLGLLE